MNSRKDTKDFHAAMVKKYDDLSPNIENRAKKLLHHMLLLDEHGPTHADELKSIFVDGAVEIRFPHATYNNLQDFVGWFKVATGALEESAHNVCHVSVKQLDKNEYEVKANIDWYVKVKGKDGKMNAEQLTMTVIDDDSQATFPKIKTLHVSVAPKALAQAEVSRAHGTVFARDPDHDHPVDCKAHVKGAGMTGCR